MFSAKILAFLITSTLFLQSTSQNKQIRGVPEVDYPTYYAIPTTSFRCSDQLYNPGFYADTETRCQVFHYCYEHRHDSFLCPMGTIFNQPILACDYWYSSNCSLAPSYYHVNKRNEDQFDEADDPIDSQSGNLFAKMAHLYDSDNKAPEESVLKNNSDAPENEFLGRDGVESSGEPLTDENNKTGDYNKYSFNNQFNMVDEEHPEVVKYEVKGSNILNIHKGAENDQEYERDDVKDFIFSEDGMLHPRQEDIYQVYPTDMNFNQEYSGYAEIPNEGNVNYDLNEDLDPENDYQISDFELQKRYADLNGDNVRRRPSTRKPIIVIPEVEPEIVKLPVVKHRRKPIKLASTVGTNAYTYSPYETNYDSNIYKENSESIINEGSESTTFDEFPLNQQNLDLNDYELRDPKLFYEIQEEIDDENGSQLLQTDNSNVIYDYSDKEETLNEYVLSNIDEDEISSNFGSGSNDFHSISNDEHRSSLIDSNYGEESETITENADGSNALGKSLKKNSEDESSFDDPFLGSGSEETINHSHSSDESSFTEDQYIFSDSEDTEITGNEASYVLPMDLSDTFEGSGIYVQETADKPNFKEVNEPAQFALKENADGSIEYGKESSFSSEAFENFPLLENPEDNEGPELGPDGSDRSNEFDYLAHELQESSYNPQDASGKTVPEIREIDGSYYYVFSDSEYDDSNGFHSENVDFTVPENFQDIFDKTTEELIDNEGSRYVPTNSKLKTDYVGDGELHTLDYQDSRHLESTYEKLPEEFETETSPGIPEESIVDDSDSIKQLSNEDLKYLEIMSQNPPPMVNNLFEVSNERWSSDPIKEMPRIEIISPEPDMNDLEKTHEDTSVENEFETNASSNTSDIEIISQEKDIGEQAKTREDPTSAEDEYEFETIVSDITSDIEHSADVKSSENSSEILNAEQIAEDVSNTEASGEDGSENFSPEQNLEAFFPGKEADPFNPLFAESDEILLDGPGSKQKAFFPGKEADPFNPLFAESDKILLDSPGSKQKLSLKVSSNQPKKVISSPVMGKDMKKIAREKRFNDNLRTFNPPNKGNSLKAPSRETFREAMFTNIPSAFLKMKHSTLRPYFYNDLKESGLNPRTGDLLQSSKLSKLTSWGRRILDAKSTKFNRMKKYIDSY